MRRKIAGVVTAATVTAGVVTAVAVVETGSNGSQTASTVAAARPALPVPPGGVAPPRPPAAPKKSAVGGLISRAEVISRAHYWYVNRNKFSYNMNGAFRDPQGRLYRTDCSGFVSMALHLPTSLSTVTLPNVGVRDNRADMHAGDFIGHLGPGTGGAGGHVRIFEKWVNKSAGIYIGYDFGSTPVKHQTYRLATDKWGTVPFTSYRYKNIR